MGSLRHPLVVLALCLGLALIPAAAQAAPLALPRVPAFDLASVFESAWSTVQSLMSKMLTTGGDDGPTSTTQTTPTTSGGGTGTPTTGGDNGPGIDPNG